ncbi:hypothetical protein [Sanguibacter sp. HDW7]|uniref:DUF7426 family protein n=1 Tax=Sanguibacter sp. HDW7 TaxID=2714931 RepID=UPI00140AC54E|nr:hypothetical protein [Sanguibacter sp. HDW7]QIK82985.1 hypothetical protein G7063_04600 [Sanguibacter sp. HDW7]
MAKSFTRYLRPNLDLEARDGKIYHVPPPTKHNGLVLAAIVAYGMNKATGRETDDETMALWESIPGDTPVGHLALTQAVYDQMLADGQPEIDVDRYALYAQYYWTLGEDAADQVMEFTYGPADDEGAAPKA